MLLGRENASRTFFQGRRGNSNVVDVGPSEPLQEIPTIPQNASVEQLSTIRDAARRDLHAAKERWSAPDTKRRQELASDAQVAALGFVIMECENGIRKLERAQRTNTLLDPIGVLSVTFGAWLRLYPSWIVFRHNTLHIRYDQGARFWRESFFVHAERQIPLEPMPNDWQRPALRANGPLPFDRKSRNAVCLGCLILLAPRVARLKRQYEDLYNRSGTAVSLR